MLTGRSREDTSVPSATVAAAPTEVESHPPLRESAVGPRARHALAHGGHEQGAQLLGAAIERGPIKEDVLRGMPERVDADPASALPREQVSRRQLLDLLVGGDRRMAPHPRGDGRDRREVERARHLRILEQARHPRRDADAVVDACVKECAVARERPRGVQPAVRAVPHHHGEIPLESRERVPTPGRVGREDERRVVGRVVGTQRERAPEVGAMVERRVGGHEQWAARGALARALAEFPLPARRAGGEGDPGRCRLGRGAGRDAARDHHAQHRPREPARCA
jgi:hypothetical protein